LVLSVGGIILLLISAITASKTFSLSFSVDNEQSVMILVMISFSLA